MHTRLCKVSGSSYLDEKLIALISQSCVKRRADNFLFIVDCRPQSSALGTCKLFLFQLPHIIHMIMIANRAAGAGYESQANYPTTRLEFFNIPNIHSVKQSFQKLSALILSGTMNDPYFQKRVDDTMWLLYIRLIIKASWDTASNVVNGIPVLVHCSHGWDRTSQVCALGNQTFSS